MNRRTTAILAFSIPLVLASACADNREIASHEAGEGGSDESPPSADSTRVLTPAGDDVTVAEYHELLEKLDYTRIPPVSEVAIFVDYPSPVVPDFTQYEEEQLLWEDNSRSVFALDGKYRHVSVKAGGICAIRLDGSPVCWLPWEPGAADQQQLLDEFMSDIRAAALENEAFLEIELQVWTAWNYEKQNQELKLLACTLSVSGRIRCWGSNEDGQLEAPERRYVQMSPGQLHACGLTAERELVCWGHQAGNYSAGSENLPSLGKFRDLSSVGGICGLSLDLGVTCWFGYIDHGDFRVSKWYYDGGWRESQTESKEPYLLPSRSNGGMFIRQDLAWGVDGGVHYRDIQHYPICGLELDGAASCLEESQRARDGSSMYTSWGERWGYIEDRLVGREDFEYLAWFGRREGPYKSVFLEQYPRCGILVDGGVECWGGSQNGTAVVPDGRYVYVALDQNTVSGHTTACGVRIDFSVMCWGWLFPRWRVDPPEGIRVLSVEEEWDR